MQHPAKAHRHSRGEERGHVARASAAGRILGRILHPRHRAVLAAAHGELGAGAAAANVLARRVHPEELFVELAAAGRRAVHVRAGIAPARLAAVQAPESGQVFRARSTTIFARTWKPSCPPTWSRSRCARPAIIFTKATWSDQRCLDSSRWIFSIRAPVGEVDLIAKTPQLVKICSKMFVPKLVGSARCPGMTLTHTAGAAVGDLDQRVDAQYFSVSKGGPCWDHIVQTRQVGRLYSGRTARPRTRVAGGSGILISERRRQCYPIESQAVAARRQRESGTGVSGNPDGERTAALGRPAGLRRGDFPPPHSGRAERPRTSRRARRATPRKTSSSRSLPWWRSWTNRF